MSQSVVYCVQTAPGRVKIGYTTDLERRLNDIELHAGEATLLRVENGTTKEESALQVYCREHRIHREFYRNEGRVADYIACKYSLRDICRKATGDGKGDVTITAAGHALSVPPSAVRAWVQDGTLKGHQDGCGTWHIDRESLNRIVDGWQITPYTAGCRLSIRSGDVRRLIAAGHLTATEVDGRTLVRLRDVDALLAEYGSGEAACHDLCHSPT